MIELARNESVAEGGMLQCCKDHFLYVGAIVYIGCKS